MSPRRYVRVPPGRAEPRGASTRPARARVYQASIPNAPRFSLGTGRTDFFLSSDHRLVSVCILRLCMHPVTSPVTAPAASVARHGTPVPHTHTQPQPHADRRHSPHTASCARGRAGRAGRGGAGARGRAGGRGHSPYGVAVYRRLCSPAGSPRSRSWRRSGTNTAAGTTRTSAAGTLLSRPRSTRLPAFLPLTVSILVD